MNRASIPAKQKIKKRLLRFKKWLLEQKKANNTKRKMLNDIKTFYREFDIIPPPRFLLN
jgi:ribosomal protein S19